MALSLRCFPALLAFCLLWHVCCGAPRDGGHAGTGVLADIPVFQWLSEGYKTFRIPGIVQSSNGTLIAVVEGRVATGRPNVGNASVCFGVLASKFDSRCVDKDIVVKISDDDGDTWAEAVPLTQSNATHFYSNPNVVLDQVTDVVWLVYYQCLVSEVYGHCTPLMTSSSDSGHTWQSGKVVEAVSTLHIGGLGGGIQLHHQENAEAQHRLILPHDGNGVIYSDDHGETWKVGSKIGEAHGENQAAELFDGSVQMTLRHGGYSPTFCTSTDGGLTFSSCHVQKQLLSDDCQTSLLAIPRPQNSTSQSKYRQAKFFHTANSKVSNTILLSSHPNSLNMVTPLGRQNLTLSVSHDNGQTWHPTVQLNPGPSAYSALTFIRYKNKIAVACLYERSKDGPPVDFDTVAMAVVAVEALL